MKKLWILTEEAPRATTLEVIVQKIAADNNWNITVGDIQITPVLEGVRFVYFFRVVGFSSTSFGDVFIKIVSGDSSFVDFLVFHQVEMPDPFTSIPLYAIEETKTDDSESRNTGVYQRLSKFVYIDAYYKKDVKRIMLYSPLVRVSSKKKLSATHLFGSRLLGTMGVDIVGQTYGPHHKMRFDSLDEMVKEKASMRKPPKGNVPITIVASPNVIRISGRLYKAGGIYHDPNIGALSAIAACIRIWNPTIDIIITKHGLKAVHLGNGSKFIRIANRLGIKLYGLKIPTVVPHTLYWHYETSREKLATILLQTLVLAYTDGEIVYANHGGTERGYLIDPAGVPHVVGKYQAGKRAVYKAGNKNVIIHLPDLVVYDPKKKEIIDVEGKRYPARLAGIAQLSEQDYFLKKLVTPLYKPTSIFKVVAIQGGFSNTKLEKGIVFQLADDGTIRLSKDCPQIIRKALGKALRP